jgi:hypothetical protein
MSIDLDALAEEFNLPSVEVLPPDVSLKTTTIELSATNVDDPDKIIAQNISKANLLLDHVIREIDNGNFSPRMIEVASLLINAINGSTTQLYAKSFNEASLQLRIKALQLKEKQLGLLARDGNVKNQNLIITDRETVLKMLKDAPDTKFIED